MKYPKETIDRLNAITAKRAATVIQHLLKNGYITTEDLENVYGYKHPPRAVRDVRELGINIETYKIRSSEGKNIAAYKFGNPVFFEDIDMKTHGRSSLSEALKQALVDKYGARCNIYYQSMEKEQLQIDHRIPYEIGGEQESNEIDCYMLLSPSANRLKSWTCEHCPNWTNKDVSVCEHCFWAFPENYTHLAGKRQKQLVVTFSENEIEDYDKLVETVGAAEAVDIIKGLIKDFIKGK